MAPSAASTTVRPPVPHFDCLVVGGGLQGVLAALALRERQPQARVALVESASRLGGNHLWSFHAQPPLPRFAEDLVVARWPGWEVRFPGFARRFEGDYASISSDRLDAVARAALEVIHASAVDVSAHEVVLLGGRRLRARLVVDARGPSALALRGENAFQKFAGVELRVEQAPALPLLMDGTVAQRDGFRFLYLLPLAPDRVLVEDTRFSLSPALDVAEVEADALAEARARGLRGEVVRREHGVLPLPLQTVDLAVDDGPLRAGYAGGFFHPTTGYSFPLALRLALMVASCAPEEAAARVRLELLPELRRQQRFALLLNRLLYRAVAEPHRWRVLARFHRLPADAVTRFYALTSTRADRARILCGAPPRGVSLRRALQELRP